MRILIADDDDATRGLLIELLARRAHSVAGVRDGREALAALDKEPFDIIFLDEEMPGMNGIATARALSQRRSSPGKHPVVIGLSGNSTEADERRCLEAGMDSFLAKPICMEDLYHVVDLFTPWPGSAAPQTTPPAQLREPSRDLAAHLRRATGGDQKLLRSLVETFLADAPKNISTLRRALARKDARALATAAHSLKGSLGIFGADCAAAAARNLQVIGRAGDLEGAAREFRALEDEIEILRRSLLSLEPAVPPRRKASPKRTKRPRPRTFRSRRKR